ncbi:MAG TPA: hypothetical protein VLT47_04990 [Anaeromyxobacteraceae bacterium]|nr:hypothetical protein [Anaeromyxobacteraceae bacterium]
MSRPAAVRTLAAAVLALAAGPAAAVPSFSRQVNMPCSACHTAFPQLTTFGRLFKAAGYALTATETVSDKRDGRVNLELGRLAPLGVQLVGSYTHVRAPGAGNRTGDVLLPDQLSVFYAGRIAPDFGAFAQVTYASDADHFSVDNLDVRWAHELKVAGRSLLVGATLNNAPTVQDLWNTTPTWGWPFVTSGVWPGMGSFTALVDGQLAQAVAGATVYGFLDQSVYAEVGLYRSAPLGVARPLGPNNADTPPLIDDAAPYWRVAVQRDMGQHLVEVGTYGLHAAMKPAVASAAPGGPDAADKLTDVAVDAEWQYQGAVAAAIRATWIREWQDLDASAPGERPRLSTLRLSGDVYRDWAGLGAGIFRTGSTTSTAFGDAGSADTRGGMAELILRPWDNATFRAQYTHYTMRDGTSTGASDADSFALIAWLAY